MPDVTVAKEAGPHGGRYVAKVAGIADEAELTFTQRGADLISADHTGAPESLRGTGAARALVDFMIADARRNGFRIIPNCPYVRAQYAKNPDWRDVMTVAPVVNPLGR
ncbi:MAG: N-acetyltransferase [Hyphomicrobiales bacterium]|nr:N-acetyltransferase [Hyphomicrobiales bacterium]